MSTHYVTVAADAPFELVPAGTEIGEHVTDGPALLLGELGADILIIEGATPEDLAAALDRWRATLRAASKVEVLVVRDPDALAEVTIFVDGTDVSTTVDIVTVDPGSGHTKDDWSEDTAALAASTGKSPEFLAAALAARAEYANSAHLLEND